MKTWKAGLAAGIVALGIFGAQLASVARRPVRAWTIEELIARSDVVAIGTAQAEEQLVADTGAARGTSVPMNTVFAVQGVLKGKVADKRLSVRHYRYADPRDTVRVVDGPAYIRFSVKQKTSYLLFLRRAKDGALEPMTGQIDPEQSFKRLDPVMETPTINK